MTGVTRESSATARPRSDSGEPWDERPDPVKPVDNGITAKSSSIDNYSTMRRDLTYEYNEQELEDGDLPTLTLSHSRSGGKGVNAQQQQQQKANLRTPSQEAEYKKQMEFWKQLDAPSKAESSAQEEGPDDEMGARRAEAREDARNNKGAAIRARKSKKSRGGNGNGDHMEQMRMADSDDSDDDSRDSKEYVVGEHDETNFCDNTLSAMEAICGESGLQLCVGAPRTGDDSNNKNGTIANPNLEQGRSRKAKNLNILNAREEGDSVDEHTAIEVEYVEPPQDTAGLEKERPENWSPTRKNAYLAAMARKAKEDFEKNQAKDMGSMLPKSKTAATAEPENSPEDVYNSLNPAEKRKFLRLINSGVSPTESAQRVRDERSNSTNNNSKSKEGKSSKKGKLFKFWKKGSSKTKESKSPTPPSPTTPPSPPPAETATATATATPLQEKQRDHDGFPVMEAENMDMGQEEKKEDDLRPVVERPSLLQETLSADDESTFEGLSHDPTQESQSQSTSVDSQKETTPEPMTISGPRSAAVDRSVDRSVERSDNSPGALEVATATSSDSTNEEEDLQVVEDLQQVVEPSPDKSSVASPDQQREQSSSTTPRGTSDSAEQDVQDVAAFDERFAKSGINYYDAVRRQLSESDDETNFSSSVSAPAKSKTNRAPRLGPILQSPKLKGFSKLSKRGKAVAQKTPTPPTHRHVAAVTPDTAVGSDWSYQEQEKLGIVTPSTGGRTERDRGEFSIQDEENNEIHGHQSPEASSFSSPALSPVYSPSAHQNEASDSSANVLVDEEEVLGRVEKELLRPVTKFTSPVPTALESTFEQKMSPTTERAAASPAAPPKDDLDFNMQDYLNSTEVYSQSGYQANDNMSVTSGTTAETSLYGGGSVFTQSTSMTQSSRKRRPGAAKTRLAKAKEAEKQGSKKKGWHESIRAAAQTNNREWKPKIGWVDYQVPDKDINIADLSTSNASSDKIHLNLSVGQASKHSVGDSLEDAARNEEKHSTFVPFPSEWEKERSAMVQEQTPVPKSAPEASLERESPEHENHEKFIPPKQSSETHEHTLPLSLDDMSIEQSVAHSVDQFVQSVGATSPARPARKRPVSSPLRTARASHSPSKRSGWVDSMRAATANIADDNQSWDPMNGWANIDAAASPENPATGTFESPSARFGQNTIEERQNEMSERLDSESPANDQSVEYSSNTASTTRDPANDRADEGSKTIVRTLRTSQQDSAVHEKYPKKELKSVKEHADYGPQLVKGENDEVSLLHTSGDFPGESLNMTPTVNVVKQKVDEEDFNWFPQTRRGSSTVWTENTQEKLQNSAQKSVSSKSSRRSRGPVDVDEAENLSDDSEEEAGVVWDGVVFETGSPSGSPSRNNAGVAPNRTEASTKSGSSTASLSSFSKIVPKLSQSKRDTSPIRAGRSPEAARGSWAEASASPPRVKSLATGIAPMEESQAVQIEESHAVRIESSQNVAASPADADDASATSSTVRKRLQEWESRVPREADPHGGDHPRSAGESTRLNSATAEWKSFLGKKVQAESAAAAERRGDNATEPQLKYIGEQNDSLFEFSVTDGGTSVGSPSRSKAGATRLDMPANQYAYAHDGSNAPPTEGSDFSDGNEINKTFLGRLASCAAPMVPKRIQNGSADALAHLAFLRTSNQQDGKNTNSRFMPPHLCGRPEVILEESEADERQEPTPTSKARASQSMSSQSMNDIKAKGSEVRNDTRSVISEDFGAKTAYLEALAMKTAVSKPRTRSGSRGRGSRSSAASDISSNSTRSHKEKWREFLDKKARAGASPGKGRGNGSDASAAAESYAAKKVEEMMAMMASRSKSTPRSWRSVDQPDENKSRVVDSMIREHTTPTTRRNVYDLSKQGVGQSQRGAQVGSGGKTDSLVAAEQLASARVNAMMQALANDSAGVEEGEI